MDQEHFFLLIPFGVFFLLLTLLLVKNSYFSKKEKRLGSIFYPFEMSLSGSLINHFFIEVNFHLFLNFSVPKEHHIL